MLKKTSYIVLAILLLVFGFILLFVPTPVGLADNTDYRRITQPLGLTVDSSLRYFYFQSKFEYAEPFYNLAEHVRFIINPNIENISGYQSTHFLPLKIAQICNGFISYLRFGKIEYFDIRILGLLFLFIHSIAVVFLWYHYPVRNKWGRIGLLLMTVLIYYDMGYLLYYHSFFGEAVILACFLLWFAALFHLLQSEKTGYFMLAVYFISGIIFVGAKVANVPLGVFMAFFSIYFIFKSKTLAKRMVIILGICAMLITSFYYYHVVPDWMKKVNNYHSLFYGVLKNSENPVQDLESFNIDTKYVILENTTGYMDHAGYDIYSDAFKQAVYDHSGPLKVSFYYLKNPRRLIEKLQVSAEASLILRPPYLGNYTKESDTEIVKFTNRYSFWENIRKQFNGAAFLTITGVFIIYFFILAFQFWRIHKKKLPSSLFWLTCAKLMLMIFAGSQWVFPIIGNGEADLSKHMFLFNLLFDMMLIMMVVDIIRLLETKQLKKHIVGIGVGGLFLFAGVVFILQTTPRNDTLTFGRYNQTPITWEILHETDTHYLVVAGDIVTTHAFSYENSNFWENSDIRKWLNDESPEGFLFEFTETEKERIHPVLSKTIVPPALASLKQSGHQPHYWFAIPGYTTQNYDHAYRIEQYEHVFLLSIKEWENHSFNKKKKTNYWLRTPYTHENVVRIVGNDGYVYHKYANMDNVGVLPALYITK